MSNATELIQFLQSLGGWPVLGMKEGGKWNESTFELQSILVTIREYGAKGLVHLDVEIDSIDIKRHILSVSRSLNDGCMGGQEGRTCNLLSGSTTSRPSAIDLDIFSYITKNSHVVQGGRRFKQIPYKNWS